MFISSALPLIGIYIVHYAILSRSQGIYCTADDFGVASAYGYYKVELRTRPASAFMNWSSRLILPHQPNGSLLLEFGHIQTRQGAKCFKFTDVPSFLSSFFKSFRLNRRTAKYN